ncbi:MAG: hypothetical protein IJ446_03835 [Oscillospiraceae bacterium]|nr:hypothetical protein [Oscillospiraceae bacterium]
MKKILTIETIMIIILSFALIVVNQENRTIPSNSSYKMTKYDFLNIGDNVNSISSIQGYDELNNQLWRNCEAFLNNVFYDNENKTSLICSETIMKRIDIINQESFKLQLDVKDRIVSNVSVISVEHTENRAVVAYAFNVSIVNENGIRKYNRTSNESCPYILCLVYHQDKEQWEIIDILIPA